MKAKIDDAGFMKIKCSQEDAQKIADRVRGLEAQLAAMTAERDVLNLALEILSKRLSGETFNHEGHAKEMRESAIAQARAEIAKESK